MNKHLLIILIILGISITSFAQKKSSEHKLKNITGTATGGSSQTPNQIKQKTINNAKINALKEAGIEENINSYTDYFRSETENYMQELFTSDILSNINGAVKNIEIIKAQISTTPEGQIMSIPPDERMIESFAFEIFR